jgi:alcohol dehydrogenase (cytochrome c)
VAHDGGAGRTGRRQLSGGLEGVLAIWDYDSASPVVLFDAGGHKGIAQASKTGWLYMLDRATGKPLYGISEEPVPQNREQKSWPTQPIPANAAFTSHGPVPEKEIARVKKEALGPLKKVPVVVAKEPFSAPPPGKLLIYGMGTQGGVNWQPVSFNEKTQMIYVCSSVSYIGIEAASTPFVRGKAFTGAAGLAGLAWPEASGTFTAIDATSGKVAWQRRFPEPCYAGTATTAGNLVFVGRNSGELQAYDARNGKRLWSFQTGAGANNTATIFKQDGKQYVAVLSGGNSLAATPHGDSLWLLGLDGTLGPAPTPGKGTGTQHAGEGGTKSAAAKGDATAGKTVFANSCATCHGADGHGGNGGPDLTGIPSAKNRNRVVAEVLNGGGGMPAFKGQLTPKQIADVAAYVTEEITNK